ncbi:MAG: hypothetical protein AB7F25_10795 [Deferribacterales bacterium]
METLTYSNIFDYFSATTGIRESVIREKLRSEGVESVSSLLRSFGREMYSTDTVLAETLTDARGKIKILDSSRPLFKHISLLLGLHRADENFATSPIVIEIKDTAITGSRHYIAKRVSDVVVGAAQKHPVFGIFASKLMQKDRRFEGLVNTSFLKLFSSTAGVRDGMRILLDLQNSPSLLEDAAAMAVVTGSMILNMQRSVSVLKSDSAPIQKLMNASLIFHSLLKHGRGHLSVCAKDDELKRALEICSNPIPLPVFGSANTENTVVKSIVTAHIFIKLLEKGGKTLSSGDAHISMNYLADAGYADDAAVSRLGRLFLAESRFKGLEMARRLRQICRFKPVIWGAQGSAASVRMLCGKGDCSYARGGRVCVTSDIKVKADKEYPTGIKAGDYFQCTRFLNQLEDLFGYRQEKVS